MLLLGRGGAPTEARETERSPDPVFRLRKPPRRLRNSFGHLKPPAGDDRRYMRPAPDVTLFRPDNNSDPHETRRSAQRAECWVYFSCGCRPTCRRAHSRLTSSAFHPFFIRPEAAPCAVPVACPPAVCAFPPRAKAAAPSSALRTPVPRSHRPQTLQERVHAPV